MAESRIFIFFGLIEAENTLNFRISLILEKTYAHLVAMLSKIWTISLLLGRGAGEAINLPALSIKK
jgi:hypothetical protein